ncbi:MAG: hypothetical protein NC218_01255, partial [Acetobacter sp.]|nr:hypothetical protein [Acetobacter sp.]
MELKQRVSFMALLVGFLTNGVASGAEENTIVEIKNAEQLQSGYVSDTTFILQNDIQLGGKVNIPEIGSEDSYQGISSFVLNGNGYTISGSEETVDSASWRFVNSKDVLVKDITFDKLKKPSNGILNFSHSTGVLDNVMISHSETAGDSVNTWGLIDVEAGGTAEIINSTFIDNNITAQESEESYGLEAARGGVLHVQGDTGNGASAVVSITDSRFENNTLTGDGVYVEGGVIYNRGKIGDVSASFINNTASAGEVFGGVLFNNGEVGNITGTFSGNKVIAAEGVVGGVIANIGGKNGKIIADFSDNQAIATSGQALGGVVAHQGTMDSDRNFQFMEFENSQFIGNKVISENGEALGGAIYGNAVRISAVSDESVLQGNTANEKNNAIYMKDEQGDVAQLELSAKAQGNVYIYDNIDGENYDIEINGDNTWEVVGLEKDVRLSDDGKSLVHLFGKIDNVNDFKLTNGAYLHLGADAEIIAENYISDGGMLWIDVNVDSATGNVNNGVIYVNGDVQGQTGVIVKTNNDELLAGKTAATNSLFLSAPNDVIDENTENNFTVSRLYGSPLMWKAVRNPEGGEPEAGSDWYLALEKKESPVDPENPDKPKPEKPSNPVYAPEVGAYAGLQSAAVEQNRSIAGSVASGLAYKKSINCYEES